MSTFRATGLAAAALVAACGSSNTSNNVVPNTASGVTAVQGSADLQVVDQIASARCKHAQACNSIGPGQRYASFDTCLDQAHASTADQLNAYNCPRGIGQDALKRCVSAIGNAQCGNAFDQLASSENCRSEDLCLR